MSKGMFRGFVVASFLLGVGWIVADFATVSQLPEELRAFHEAEPELTPAMWIAIFLAVSLCILYLIAFVGLLVFWRPARPIYLIASVGGFFIPFLLGPTVATAITNGFAYLNCASSGFVLALLYYSPIKQDFDSPESAAP